MTAEIVSIGDRVFPGEFSLHSRFRRVVNFTAGGKIIAVVAEGIGPGPVNIVVRGINPAGRESLRIDDKTIQIGPRSFPYDRRKIFNSRIIPGEFEKEKLAAGLRYFEEALLNYSSPSSLAFLIDPDRKAYFKTPFEMNFVTAVGDAVGLIFNGGVRGDLDPGDNFFAGIKKIKGVGFGLTPSGDDFIAGLLAALNLLESLDGVHRKDMKREISAAARGENLLSNSFITLARDGFFFERFHGLISALPGGDKKRIFPSARALLAHGETSGSDMAVGFLLTLKFLPSAKKLVAPIRSGD